MRMPKAPQFTRILILSRGGWNPQRDRGLPEGGGNTGCPAGRGYDRRPAAEHRRTQRSRSSRLTWSLTRKLGRHGLTPKRVAQ